jgi:hypothetical protein
MLVISAPTEPCGERMQQRRLSNFAASPAFAVAILFHSIQLAWAADERAVGSPSPGNFLSLALPAGCFSQLYQTPFDSFRKVKHCLQAWTEYNTSTCASISAGSYDVTVAPKHGALSLRLIPLTQVPLYVASERSASVRGIARKPGHGAGPFARRVSESIRRRGELRHVSVQASLARGLRLSRLRQAPRQCA